jgi:hypothetical protein
MRQNHRKMREIQAKKRQFWAILAECCFKNVHWTCKNVIFPSKIHILFAFSPFKVKFTQNKPKSPHKHPKSSQNHPKTGQNRPILPQNTSKTPKIASKLPQKRLFRPTNR